MSFEREMAQRVAAEDAVRLQEEKNQKAQEQRTRFEEYQRLEKLLKMPEVIWLLEQFQRRVDQERESALSVAVAPEEAERARQRHSIAKELTDMLPSKFTELKNRIFDENSQLTPPS